MQPDELSVLLRRLRVEPIWREPSLAVTNQTIRIPPVEDLLPHRSPFLLIDSVRDVDLATARLRAARRLDPNDPVFAGHFPRRPVYPGVLLIEIMGQAAVCLHALRPSGPAADFVGVLAPNVMATRIHHAVFRAPVLPGDNLDVHVAIVDDASLGCIFAGQVWIGGALSSFAVGEFYDV